MARIRTLKPEFWTDGALGECSPTARLLFVGTWTYADDYGDLERSARQLKAQCFPYDSIDCEPLILELIAAGRLIEYEADGKKYLHIKGFERHQRIDKKSSPRVPLYKEYESPPRALPEPSEKKASEGNGREGKGIREASPPSTENGPPRTKKPRVGLPDDFALSDAMRSKALAKHPDCDPDQMFEQFVAHHRSHGNLMADWSQAWTTWIGNASKFGYEKRASRNFR